VLEFTRAKEWERWLARNNAKAPDGVWLRFYKKASGKQTFTFPEALEVALCYGWIDAQGKSENEESSRQRFLPRRKRSTWSRINTENAERLIEQGRMKPAGLAEIERAKQDGRWAAAYDSPSTSTVPDDFLALLAKNKKAKAFFETLNKANRYAITYRLQTAKKPETRERRMKAFIEMLAKGQKLH
jgi:uncharacterized protein YdeI (YjbR/CyaY-like superfamily)